MLPFGCHAWHRYNPQFYKKLFIEFGYDTDNILNNCFNMDQMMIIWLMEIAQQRVLNRLDKNQSIIQYLPYNQFDTIYVIRNKNNIRILNRLLADDIFVNNIYIANNEQNIELNKLALIITLEDDSNLIQYLERNYIYGKQFISFRQEYLRYYQNIFNMLGK